MALADRCPGFLVGPENVVIYTKHFGESVSGLVAKFFGGGGGGVRLGDG